jgi:predicted nuclease of predicted toxin-antitoxin system
MKLLIDANISWRLAKLLHNTFPDILHVERTGLPIPAEDTLIWDWAKDNDYIIVTNDEDFLNMSIQMGFPPKVILLRMGNQSTKNVAIILEKYKADIEYLASDPYSGVLEIF